MIARPYGAAVVLAVALASGCSSGTDPDPSATRATAPPPIPETAPELPKGMQWVEHEIGVRIAVPKRWTVIHGESADDPANADAMKQLGKIVFGATGPLRANLREDDYLAVGERASIYVGRSRADSLPTEEELRADVDRSGGYARIDTSYSDLGPVTTMTFGVSEPRGVATFLFVEVEDAVAFFGVAGRTHDQSTYAVSEILRTISATGS